MNKKILFAILGLLMIIPQTVSAQMVNVASADYSQAVLQCSIPKAGIGMIEAFGHPFTTLTIEGSAPSFELGKPNLPQITKLVEVPINTGIEVEVTNMQTISFGDKACKYPVEPVQPARSKSDTAAASLVMDSLLYSTDGLYSLPVARVEPIGIARDRNLVRLHISPFSYNPVTGRLDQIVSLTVTIKYKNPDIAATRQMHSLHHSPDFTVGTNALVAMPQEKDIVLNAPLHYLIVSHSSFRGQLDSFIAWKRNQGFLVTVAYTGDPGVGTLNTEIASYIKRFYTNATPELPAPTYLLLVGDHDQIPAFSARCGSPATNHITDLYFATWTPNDHIPDCYYGRFSARTAAELQPQIEKTIFYERYGFSDDEYLGRGVLIAGVDQGSPSDWAYRYADPAMDYTASQYINAANRYHSVYYYKNNISFAPTGVTVTGSSNSSNTDGELRALYNTGCGFVNYSAHGYDDSWSTPSFSTAHVALMTNYGKPSIMIGNCCLSGRFNTTNYDACLGEALLRRDGNAGAVGYIGGTNSTYWPEDFTWSVGIRSNVSNQMNAQYDTANLGMYDRLFHTHGEPFSAWHNTMGSMIGAGNMAVEASGSSRAYYYWEIYQLFGDPSLMPWLGAASDMTVSADEYPGYGISTYSVHAVPHAYVALVDTASLDLIAAAYADQNGHAILRLPADLDTGHYSLAIWAQNYKPYSKIIHFTILQDAFVVLRDVQPAGAAAIVPGRMIDLDAVIQNIGNAYPTQGLITLECHTPGVVIAQPEAHFNAIAPGETQSLSHMWTIYVPETLADRTPIDFTAIVNFGNGTSRYTFTCHVVAPKLAITATSAQPTLAADGSSVVICQVVNQGHDSTVSLTFLLPNLLGFMTETPAPCRVGVLAPGQSCQLTFPVAMAHNTPVALLPFRLYATDDTDTMLVGQFNLPAVQPDIEDFETGSFASYNWTQGINPWELTVINPYNGSYSARSKTNLSDRARSQLSIQLTSTVDDSLSFYYKVSSEEDYDFFIFTIDGEEHLRASGEEGWSRFACPVSAGTHTFVFSYVKDQYKADGSDCAWLDDIRLPFKAPLVQCIVDTVCQNVPYDFNGQDIPTDQTGLFHYSDTIDRVYTCLALNVTTAPHVHIETLGNPALGECLMLRAKGATTYQWNTGDTSSCIAVCPEEGSTYTVTGCRAGCCDNASLTLLGIGQASDRQPLSVYPNPATDRVTVACDFIGTLRLVNLMGQTVYSAQVDAPQAVIPLQNLPKGVYFIDIKTPNRSATSKLVIK